MALEYLDETLRDATAIRADLGRRWHDVDEEIRHYPTPIARCDVQLTALLETREELRYLRTIEDDDRLIGAYATAVRRWSQR